MQTCACGTCEFPEQDAYLEKIRSLEKEIQELKSSASMVEVSKWLRHQGYGIDGEAFLALDPSTRPTIQDLITAYLTKGE